MEKKKKRIGKLKTVGKIFEVVRFAWLQGRGPQTGVEV